MDHASSSMNFIDEKLEPNALMIIIVLLNILYEIPSLSSIVLCLFSYIKIVQEWSIIELIQIELLLLLFEGREERDHPDIIYIHYLYIDFYIYFYQISDKYHVLYCHITISNYLSLTSILLHKQTALLDEVRTNGHLGSGHLGYK